ncbi:hypothetical protein BVE79_00005 [Salmonella enterica]|nr:hypothetical protein AC247_11995 [Salmonella enterica subsp. enterica serovar Ouakam]ASG09949.1 hypothetical protein LFZ36_00800 [Salmonella enterica subsp. enterica serovar Ouakam str. SA20034636]EAC2032701.1 hypothetical protein [Salmonella enterica subsp. enterica]EAM8686248.1 hypothetical protein [Salmonella enterica]EBW8617615.1 hypothetical protein [Salmonella enterica subsp. enterica serovar Enteritidis]KRT29146.1 hypothetical protein LPMST01_04045 [Salmonella enterica subsp. enteric
MVLNLKMRSVKGLVRRLKMDDIIHKIKVLPLFFHPYSKNQPKNIGCMNIKLKLFFCFKCSI